MQQYNTQYGTIFAVREYKGHPAIMLRPEHKPDDWSLSSMIEPFTPGAWTAEELQAQLDNWAATKGWQPVAEPASAEPPEIADEGSGPEDGFPDWVRPMAAEFLSFEQVRKMPAFTTAAFKQSDIVRQRWGGSFLSGGLYDTSRKGIRFSAMRKEVSYTWADFICRCRAAGLAPEPPHQDKEDAPCKPETPAPTGAAAATTAASAVPMPSTAAETTTTSESGAGANSCGTPAPAAQPSNEPPAELAPTASRETTTFDFGALDADTAEKLRGITDCVMELYQSYAWGMAYQVGRAHDLLCGEGACETVSQAGSCKTVLQLHKANGNRGENTFTAWCAYIGVNRQTAYNLLNAYRLICKATPEQQKNLQLAPAKLLYETGKKDVPDQLVTAVLDGDITTHKQYQGALARIRTLENQNASLLHSYETERGKAEAADRRADKAEQTAKDTARERDAALKQRDEERRRAAEAEKQRDGARDALQAAKLRGDKLKAENDVLKAHPIEAQVVDEEEINRRAQARADELTAPMREELEALRARHPADPEEAEQAVQDAYDSTIYTGRVIESAWRTLRPLLACMDEARREQALRQLSKTISQIQGEICQCL